MPSLAIRSKCGVFIFFDPLKPTLPYARSSARITTILGCEADASIGTEPHAAIPTALMMIDFNMVLNTPFTGSCFFTRPHLLPHTLNVTTVTEVTIVLLLKIWVTTHTDRNPRHVLITDFTERTRCPPGCLSLKPIRCRDRRGRMRGWSKPDW